VPPPLRTVTTTIGDIPVVEGRRRAPAIPPGHGSLQHYNCLNLAIWPLTTSPPTACCVSYTPLWATSRHLWLLLLMAPPASLASAVSPALFVASVLFSQAQQRALFLLPRK